MSLTFSGEKCKIEKTVKEVPLPRYEVILSHPKILNILQVS